ncbi:MAG: hypothetical protein JSV63_03165 [Candidatus Aenigmatarchaeota archaeon]|nr:MAG: hypothetical protein JSV63_03165 [Candidatus Aenigmarchaeota archaeon]
MQRELADMLYRSKLIDLPPDGIGHNEDLGLGTAERAELLFMIYGKTRKALDIDDVEREGVRTLKDWEDHLLKEDITYATLMGVHSDADD